ncbi:MAG TPA: copper resistance protein CopC, partial [bacterium]|nr:copper resistance protein CopC [bacterium]
MPDRLRLGDPHWDADGGERGAFRGGGGVDLIGPAGRRRLLVAVGAALVWVAVRAPGTLAHATLVGSTPPDLCSPTAAPRPLPGDPRCATGVVLPDVPPAVRLTFNEPVELVGRGVRVLAPDGRRVARGPARTSGSVVTVPIDGAGAGTYLVVWRVIARDTHPSQGIFAFSVGRPSPPGGALSAGAAGAGSIAGLILQMAARALHLAGYALSFGVLAYRQAVLRPLGLAAEVDVDRRIWRLVGIGVLALLVAEPLALVAQASSLGAGIGGPLDPGAIGDVLDSSFGRVLAQRLGAALLLWVLAGAVRTGRDRVAVASLVLGVALACVDGQAAHAAGARPAWLGLGLNTLHVAAMGAWVGGVFG